MGAEDFHIKTILLADDDTDDREFFQDALMAITNDITLITAENGNQVLNMLHNNDREFPDLVFLDLNMPLRNGYECLSDIKQDERLKHLPVIIFSTSLQPQTTDIVYNSGASLYIIKPNSFPALKSLLKKVLAFNWRDISGQTQREDFILQI